MLTRTLIAVRHAEAAPHSRGGDRSRPLTRRGALQARELGGRLAEFLGRADQVFLSPALRAQQTWESMLAGAGVTLASTPWPSEEEIVYDGSPDQIARRVLSVVTGPGLVIVGHEPTISALAFNLASIGGASVLEYGMPTGSAAVLQSDLPWDQWRGHVASLVDFVHVRPR